MTTYFIIFGAAVLRDGNASGTLARRVQGALDLARDVPDRMFLATGGVGRYGPAEALVSRDLLLRGGAADHEIVIEDRATDTLESVIFCHAMLRARGDADRIVPCTSRYHIPRCALLLRIVGHGVLTGAMPSDRPHVARGLLALYILKECLATPYDALLLLVKRAIGALKV